MNKRLKKVLLVIASLIVLALVMHMANMYLFPFIAAMHGGGAY